MLEVYPRGYYGVDKIGRPVYIDCAGRLKVKELTEIITEEKFWEKLYH